MSASTIYLAFANTDDAHLPLLEDERKAISEALLPLASAQKLMLYTEPSATAQDLVRAISGFKNQISIFHYAGHASGQQIFLKGQAADAAGVAELLAAQENLQLVFLNGCSTRAQVKHLLDMGIPAVIATSVPIGDRAAQRFSAAFYGALVTQHSIEEAFKIAAAAHQMATGQPLSVYRSLDLGGDDDSAALPWGLYVRQGREAVLDWALPTRVMSSPIVRGAGMSYQAAESINNELIINIANAIAPYSEAVEDIMEGAKRRGRDLRMRDLRAAVIDSFPTPIGTHLRKLLLLEEVNTDRLSKLTNVYTVSTQLLSYIMLAQLWDEKFSNRDLLIPEQQAQQLRNFFEQAAPWDTYNFIELLRAAGDIFELNKIKPFVTEFEQLRHDFFTNEDFQTACMFLEAMKLELRNVIAADEIESFCVQTEKHLAEVFQRIGFAAHYTLATVKNIELLKGRHQDPRYRHYLVILNKVTAGQLDEPLESSDFADNDSVLLLRGDEAVTPYLNLTPLLIDENALTRQQNSKLFFFDLRQRDRYRFVLSDNLRDELWVDGKNYEVIKLLFERFYRDLITDTVAETS